MDQGVRTLSKDIFRKVDVIAGHEFELAYYESAVQLFNHYTTGIQMVFHRSLSDSKSSQVSRTLLSILAVLSNLVVLMVSTSPSTSKSYSPFNNPLVTVPNAPITIDMIVTCMFYSFFNSLAKSRYLSLLFTFCQFYSVVCQDSKVDNFASSLLFVCWLLLGLVFLLLLLLWLLLLFTPWKFSTSV